jgi:hypothetical protein
MVTEFDPSGRRSSITPSNSAKSSYNHALCDEHSSLNDKSSTASGGINAIGYGDANFNSGSKDVQDMKSKYCQQDSGEMSDDDFRSLVQVTIDPFVVQNWRECMQSQGKGLYADVDVNGQDVIFTFQWQGFAGVNSVTVDNSPQVTGAVCAQPNIKAHTVLLDRVDVTELCHRLGDSAVTYVLNTSGGAKTLKLSPRPKPQVSQSVRYRPSDPMISALPAMNLIVAKSQINGQTHLRISFVIPPPPSSSPNFLYRTISVYGFQLGPNKRFDLPPSTFQTIQVARTAREISAGTDLPSPLPAVGAEGKLEHLAGSGGDSSGTASSTPSGHD